VFVACSWPTPHSFTESNSNILSVYTVKTHRTRDGTAPLIYNLASEWSTSRPLTFGEKAKVPFEQEA
jgi:hypothetical protein